MKIKHPAQLSAIILGLFAIVATTLVSFTFTQTQHQIKENERLALLNALQQLVPEGQYNNNMLTDFIQINSVDIASNKQTVTVYRARLNGDPKIVIFSPVVTVGYAGYIKLLIGIRMDGSLSGVRVVSHRETPGLGDAIDSSKSDWIFDFDNRSLTNPEQERWLVKKDGGEFDQFTGATITPRSIVQAVKKSLIYFESHKTQLIKVNSGEPNE